MGWSVRCAIFVEPVGRRGRPPEFALVAAAAALVSVDGSAKPPLGFAGC